MLFARHFLAIFLGRFAWVFVFVQIFLGLCSVLVFSAAYPYVSPRLVAASVPDILLLVLPLSFAISTLGGALLFVEEVRRAEGFLAIELAGRDPRWLQLPIVVVALALSGAGYWLATRVIPNAEYRLEEMATTIVRDTPLMALRAVRDGDMLKGLAMGFESVDSTAVKELTLLSESKATAITASRGRFDVVEDGRFLSLALEDGRYLQLDKAQQLSENASFERLEIQFDAARVGPGAKVDILPLRFYTDAELDRLVEVPALRLRHGYRPTPRQTLRVAAIPSARAARLAASSLPFLVAVLVVSFLGVHLPHGAGLRRTLVLGAVLLVLIPEQLIILHVAANEPLRRVWLAFLPAAEAAAALLVGAAAALVRR